MNPSPFYGRRLSLALLFLGELALVWIAATAITIPLLAPLHRHPEGPFALLSDGGRVLFEMVSTERTSLFVAGASLAVLTLLFAAIWLLLGGVIPVLAVVEPAPPLHRAASYSLRRMPTLLGLAVLALAGYAIAGAAGGFAWVHLSHTADRLVDARAADLLRARAMVPAALIAALVTVWHDVARTWAVGAGRGVRGSTVDALAVMVTAPLQTLGRAALYALLGALSVVVAFVASLALGGRDGAALYALIAVQQGALAWRFGCRARWLVHLGALYRERAAPAETASE